MTMNRRDFMRFSITGAGMLAAGRLFGHSTSGKKPPIGVQLYTVRRQAESDLPGTLAALHKIGYQEVELYWNVYSHPARELKKMIADSGLRAPSGHFDYDGLESKLDYAQDLSLDWIVCPMLPNRMWTAVEGFQKAADQFNQWGEEIQKRGMRFGFHNHNYEFRHFGKTTGFETLMQRTDPRLVALEMDCYWITQSGHDPVKMMKQLGKRVRMLHLKDRKPGSPTSTELNASAEHFTPVGAGSIDWKSVLAEAEKIGVEHWFVEQDETEGPPLKALETSYANLKKLLA